MKLTLFWRLMIGFLIIFILVLTVGVYAMVQLKELNGVTYFILNVDQNILKYHKRIMDQLFSQHRFLKKYLITKDQGLYERYLTAGEQVTQALVQASGIAAQIPAVNETLQRASLNYKKYDSLVLEELEQLRGKSSYPVKWYAQEKETLLDNILKELDLVEVQVKEDINQRMRLQKEAGESARQVAAGLSLLAMASIIIISLLLTRSITQPLKRLRLKTRDISEGIFTNDLIISSPPEIAELTRSFNQMSHKLMTLDKMKSDFFSTMSHELRTPLTSIKEGIALLQEEAAGPVTEKQKRLLTILAQESRRLIDLISSSLDFSKMESGMMTYRFEWGDLSLSAEKVLQEMTPLLEAKRITLEKDFRDILPKIRMDHERILQVFRNLLGNAVKFSPEGGLIKVEACKTGQGVQVAVKDTGPGIPPEHLSTIFNKFHQVVPNNAYHVKGTGLGLAIVKHIIQSHGGRTWAESRVGEGSTFYFWLPA
jgi:two-component system, NtrC family, sensor histidine kinase GlrK